MTTNPNQAVLTGNDELGLKKKTVFHLTCPNSNCENVLDVTKVKQNTYIQCSKCSNVTWNPGYNPPWQAKTKYFMFSLISALAIGIFSTLFVNWILNNGTESKTNNLEKTEINKELSNNKI
ncbi:MAG: Uncharacterised protein [Formosa sp. Hel1_33_131]|nr:MAG: Uncharacterised protein [Formosa sp. Hel1_33_131]|tara:strand:+ start:114 stop:476 length:363 start_codon:yes stop_codon:yes gene_type:complete